MKWIKYLIIGMVLIMNVKLASSDVAYGITPATQLNYCDDIVVLCTSVPWTDEMNISIDDNRWAYVSVNPLLDPSNSEYLVALNYSFNIPTTATINGIKVTYLRNVTRPVIAAPNNITDYSLVLFSAGVPLGDDKAVTTPVWSNTVAKENKTYGNMTDLWGIAWTPSLINAVDFGVGLSIVGQGLNSRPVQAKVTYVMIEVNYTPASTSSFCDRTKDCHLNCSQRLSNINYDAGGHSIIWENTTPTGHVYLSNVSITNFTGVVYPNNCFVDKGGGYLK